MKLWRLLSAIPVASSSYSGVGIVGVRVGGGKRVERALLLKDRVGDVLSISRRCLRSDAALASDKASSTLSTSAYQKAA